MNDFFVSLKGLVNLGHAGDKALLKGKNYMDVLVEASEPPLVKAYFEKKFSQVNAEATPEKRQYVETQEFADKVANLNSRNA